MMVVRKLYDRLTPRVVSVVVGAGVLSPTSLAARRWDADPESRRLDVAVFGGFADHFNNNTNIVFNGDELFLYEKCDIDVDDNFDNTNQYKDGKNHNECCNFIDRHNDGCE